MKMRRSARTACALALVLGSAATSRAALVMFMTPAGAMPTGSELVVSAKATFTTSTDQVDVVLENLTADPRSVQQALSGLFFTLDGGQTGGTLLSSQGTERNIDDDGSLTVGSAVAMGWAFSNSDPASLNVLGTMTAPEHLIIGPPAASNIYANANNSITGNDPHNPFIGLSATFSINIPGVTAATQVTSATFQFNTSPGFTVIVPEPASVSILAAPALMLRRRRD